VVDRLGGVGEAGVIGITARQREVLEFVMDFVRDHGNSPSIREVAEGAGLTSLRGGSVHLEALERKGYLRRHGVRGIQVLRGPDGVRVELEFLTASG